MAEDSTLSYALTGIRAKILDPSALTVGAGILEFEIGHEIYIKVGTDYCSSVISAMQIAGWHAFRTEVGFGGGSFMTLTFPSRKELLFRKTQSTDNTNPGLILS